MSRYVFGPVPSRRLGRSLGIDVVPFKTCTYDCIYCQLGQTTLKTMERRKWIPLDDAIAELKSRLSSRPDYITLSGSGEPTLDSQVGELIDKIKSLTDIPVAVLTNGSLLWQEDLRRELLAADLVIPSLDAGDEATFQMVNRPHEEISFEQMVDGLVGFRNQYKGEYWLEVMLIDGCSGNIREIGELADRADRIRPDRVQLNTVTRPPADAIAVGLSPEQLAGLTTLFHPAAEAIADFRGVHRAAEFVGNRHEVLALLRRRPCTVDDIAFGLEMHRSEVVKYLAELVAQAVVETSEGGNQQYYKANP